MAELKQCEFFLLRYVPDAIRQQFVDIAVALMEVAPADCTGFAGVRFAKDWQRVTRLDPAADVDYLDALRNELMEDVKDAGNARALRLKLDDSFSHVIQASAVQTCLAENPRLEMETLARHYLDFEWPAAHKAKSARKAIYRQMRHAFEQEGVWKLMQKAISVEKFTRKGDPLKIDCGYQPNGVIKLFHSVPLQADTELAKVLAFSIPQIEAGIRRERNARTEFTAIVEDDLDRSDEAVLFSLATLHDARITVANISQLPQIAKTARQELKL